MPQGPLHDERSVNCTLLGLPAELLCEHVLGRVDAGTLARLELCSRFFRTGRAPLGSLAEQAACQKLTTSIGTAEAQRFKGLTWKQRLWFEESLVGFDTDLLQLAGVTAQRLEPDGPIRSMSLQNRLGPKLLVSDVTTSDRNVLRWRLRVTGNMAVEFGMVPTNLARIPTALHKGQVRSVQAAVRGFAGQRPQRRDRASPVGFCSLTTGGSTLPFKAPVHDGCIVEITAQCSHVEYLISNPPETEQASLYNEAGGMEVDADAAVEVFLQQPRCSVPREVRFQHDILPDCAYRLASTCWANGQLEVISSFTSCQDIAAPDTKVDDVHFDSNNAAHAGHADTSLVVPGGSVTQTDVS